MPAAGKKDGNKAGFRKRAIFRKPVFLEACFSEACFSKACLFGIQIFQASVFWTSILVSAGQIFTFRSRYSLGDRPVSFWKEEEK